jgi:hypothetical protein
MHGDLLVVVQCKNIINFLVFLVMPHLAWYYMTIVL